MKSQKKRTAVTQTTTQTIKTSIQSVEKILASLPVAEIRMALLPWFQHQQRDLPWRQSRDPYAIWVSEVMLQQTRVATVLPYYSRFLEAFPTVRDLALAHLDQVLALWSGLGYYRRAKHLHQGAQDIMQRFGGQMPANYRDLLSIKGIGRYTAGAIASIAFQLPYPAVDGNVYRIFARWFCLEDPVTSTALQKTSEALATQLVQGERPGDWNQALMELGALICTPKNPSCFLCPVRERCQAFIQGDALAYPRTGKATPVQDVAVYWALIQQSDRVLLVQRPHDGLFAGMWELPGMYTDYPGESEPQSLYHQIQQAGLDIDWRAGHEEYQHVLTHRRLHIRLYRGQYVCGQVSLPQDTHRWIIPTELSQLAISSITRKILLS